MTTYLGLLFVALSAVSKPCFAAFVSIDCGSISGYTDGNSIRWSGDGNYTLNGLGYEIDFPLFRAGHVVSTLRAFTTPKKNCYTIYNLENGERVLVRATFYYSNYDGKNNPPSFDLLFDGNLWRSLNLSEYGEDKILTTEVIYAVIGNSTSICVAQTVPNQRPFINSIELRSLDSKMYNHAGSNRFLYLLNRAAQGANQTIRYPEDPYDRVWYPYGAEDHQENVTNVAATIHVSSAEDQPPQAVLRNAIASTSTMVPVVLDIARTSTMGPAILDTNVPGEKIFYIAIYFSEVIQLELSHKRSIQIYIDNDPYNLDPIIPPFGSVLEVPITNLTAFLNTTITVWAASNSTLPPLINAYEVYAVFKAQPSGTNSKDVQGLVALQNAFNDLQQYTGDPCLPPPHWWEWVHCSTGAMPRIIGLNLSSSGLAGSLPDFSSMDALQRIDFSQNSLNGPIPEFLGSFRHLGLLVTGNCLDGMSCPEQNPTSLPPSAPPSSTFEAPPPPVVLPNETKPPLTSTGNRKNVDKIPIILGATIQGLLLFLLQISINCSTGFVVLKWL
ncbi:hypothetical protein CJ030_MR5G001740 [Morella rubra]|uniref:Malectin-like domain-containing protein n=1 Tax=Morella rubra TaxID=262757 RepID=A0A6A1VK22_9ROSI|nr:hypothetical protein CJ030_MR5G001740 [Morella rubra]